MNHADGRSAAEPLEVRVRRRTRSLLREYVESLIIAVLLALAIRGFIVQAFVIPSGSMLPTLQIGDYVLVNKFLYTFQPIRRGDIIVFKFPKDESRDFIKRVIGLPGEILEIQGPQVFINGKPLHEPYAVHTGPVPFPASSDHFGPILIPRGRLFMMGDNRDNSLDSRFWGLLDKTKVLGKATIIYFSVRSQDIPSDSLLPRIFYVLARPSLIRWSRIGRIIR